MKVTEHPCRNCPEHLLTRLVLRRNPKGGLFWGCTCPGCRYTWSDDHDRYFGPSILAERYRGGKSEKYRCFHELLRHGFSVQEAHKVLKEEGVQRVAAMLAA